ncbi:MAG: hypothetical protein LBV49_02580, partial [Azonexus sp.]|nr:hypothetical protein [Azonexus sp.]
AIYLNPHFRDAALAHALSAGLDAAGLTAHRVGEGYAGDGLAGWVGVDEDWATKAAHAKLLVSAPGMAALSIAQVYQRPILLVLTDQPEQAANAARAAQLGLKHRAVIWRGDGAQFEAQVKEAAADLTRDAARQAPAAEGRERAQMRVEAWVERIFALGADAPPPAANRLRERQPS